jgi:hypothetical protein
MRPPRLAVPAWTWAFPFRTPAFRFGLVAPAVWALRSQRSYSPGWRLLRAQRLTGEGSR